MIYQRELNEIIKEIETKDGVKIRNRENFDVLD